MLIVGLRELAVNCVTNRSLGKIIVWRNRLLLSLRLRMVCRLSHSCTLL